MEIRIYSALIHATKSRPNRSIACFAAIIVACMGIAGTASAGSSASLNFAENDSNDSISSSEFASASSPVTAHFESSNAATATSSEPGTTFAHPSAIGSTSASDAIVDHVSNTAPAVK
jgi:hypothetical protein